MTDYGGIFDDVHADDNDLKTFFYEFQLTAEMMMIMMMVMPSLRDQFTCERRKKSQKLHKIILHNLIFILIKTILTFVLYP
jgi:hypothetical protein